MEKRLQKFIKEKNYNIKIHCNEKGWVDKNQFENWIAEVWFINYSFKPANNTVLVLDQAATHFLENLDDLFEKYNSKYLVIPKGCTSYCLPLDKSIKKLFKDHLRSEYNNYLIKNYNTFYFFNITYVFFKI